MSPLLLATSFARKDDHNLIFTSYRQLHFTECVNKMPRSPHILSFLVPALKALSFEPIVAKLSAALPEFVCFIILLVISSTVGDSGSTDLHSDLVDV